MVHEVRDVVDNINNRVVTYSSIAYDYNLNPTNTISAHEENNDIHSCEG